MRSFDPSSSLESLKVSSLSQAGVAHGNQKSTPCCAIHLLEARGGERKLAGPPRPNKSGAGWSAAAAAAAAAAALGLLLLLLLLCGLLQLLGGRLQMLGVLQLLGGPAHRAQGGVEPRRGGGP